MTDVDISLLTRITPAALAANPDLGMQVIPILEAANSDGQANEEDRVFTEAEATAYINRLRQSHQQTLGIFNRHRSHLAGSLASAQERVRGETGSQNLVNLLEMAASQDAQNPGLNDTERRRLAGELSAEEVTALAQHLEQMTREGEGLSAAGIQQSVQPLLQLVQAMEQSIPEAMIPTDEAAQHADIDLNFLKYLPSSVFTNTDEDSQLVQSLIRIAQVDPAQTGSDWRLSFSELQTFLASQPNAGSQSAERVMADFRFISYQIRDAVNQMVATAGSDAPELQSLRLSVQPLIDRHSQINNPSVDEVLELAQDSVLTTIEVERILLIEEQRHPGFIRGLADQAPAATDANQTDIQRATAFYMSEIRTVIDRYNHEIAVLNPTAEDVSVDADLTLSRHVLTALENMRSGFTHRDREYAERNALVGLIDMISYVCTFGGALTWIGAGSPQTPNAEEVAEYGADWPRFGPTYRHLVRGSVASHDDERGRALNALREIIEHPPADFHGARTIPNALDYLRDHDDSIGITSGRGFNATVIPGSVAPGTGQNRRHYDLLTGDFFQARRLWQIHSEANASRQAQMWYDLAQNLRSGDAGGLWSEGTHADGIRNTDYARAILHALQRLPSDTQMHHRARLAFADSMGQDITDEHGHVITQSNGEFGVEPWLWFRNYSDESADAVASDVVALGASIYISGGLTSLGRSALTTGGTTLRTGILRFLSQRATQTVATEAVVGTAIEGSTTGMGIFGHAMSRLGGPAWASRLVASREAALRAAVSGGTSAEVRAAQTALSRARDIQSLLTAPTIGAGVDAAAPRLTGWGARIVNAHPPVPASWAQVATGTGLRALAARGGTSALTNLQLGSLGRGFNWFMNSGIFIYGMTGIIFGRTRTRVDQENMQDFDMSYDLLLSAQPNPPAASAPVPDTSGSSPDAAIGDASADDDSPAPDNWLILAPDGSGG